MKPVYIADYNSSEGSGAGFVHQFIAKQRNRCAFDWSAGTTPAAATATPNSISSISAEISTAPLFGAGCVLETVRMDAKEAAAKLAQAGRKTHTKQTGWIASADGLYAPVRTMWPCLARSAIEVD